MNTKGRFEMTHYSKRLEATTANNRRKPFDRAKLERLMNHYNVESKGKTLSGHFSPEDAIDVLEAATSRGRSVSEIVTASVRIGLPSLKKQIPRLRDFTMSVD